MAIKLNKVTKDYIKSRISSMELQINLFDAVSPIADDICKKDKAVVKSRKECRAEVEKIRTISADLKTLLA